MEVETKSSLKWYWMVKDGEVHVFGRSGRGKALVYTEDRISRPFLDKKWCKMCDDERCVLCNSGEVEDVEHFLMRCEEFRWERQDLLEKIGRWKEHKGG